jgi:hypothetical protein
MSLIQEISNTDSLIRLLVDIFFQAVTVLLHNAIYNPFHRRARSDILLVEPFLGLLEALDDGGDNTELQKMRVECSSLIQNAMIAIDSVEDATVG